MATVLSGGTSHAAASAEERQLRIDLAASYRLVARQGWEDLIFTHISAQIPETDDYLINPFGIAFDEMTASALVRVDPQGTILEDTTGLGINPGGFIIHGAVHTARPDAACVMHLHTVEGVAVACQADGLLPLQQGALMILPDLAYHDFEGVALDLGERERLIANLGTRNHMILRNHGLLTVGATVGQAFARMYALQRACEIQVAAQGSRTLIEPSLAVREKVSRQNRSAGDLRSATLAWDAMRRRLDRVDPSYAN